jgi:putative ABC transport system permease protein
LCYHVLGVVDDVTWDIAAGPQPNYYLVADPGASRAMNNLVIRTRGPADEHQARAVRQTLAAHGASEHARVRVVSDRLEPQVRPWRLASALLAAGGLIATVVAMLGLHGLVRLELTQRRSELGVRLALGASPHRLALEIVGRVSRIVLPAILLAVPVAFACGVLLSSVLYATDAFDVAAAGSAIVAVLASVIVATGTAAIKASRAIPADLIRS